MWGALLAAALAVPQESRHHESLAAADRRGHHGGHQHRHGGGASDPFPACGSYVFGFSTGHTGTTTVSDRNTYVDGKLRRLSSVAFFFEEAQMSYHTDDVSEEVRYVEHVYLPKLKAKVAKWKGARTLLASRERAMCVDLSHFNLFYFRGLVQVLRAHKKPFSFVRIRRDAIEIARSLLEYFHNPDNPLTAHDREKGNRFHMAVGYTPSEAPGSVVLKLDVPTWANLTELQQGLWRADEVEAQWRKHVDGSVRRQALNVSWAKSDSPTSGGDPFHDECVDPIARRLGLRVSPSLSDHKGHVDEETAAERDENIKALSEYQQKMSAHSAAFRELQHDLPTSQALSMRAAKKAAAALVRRKPPV